MSTDPAAGPRGPAPADRAERNQPPPHVLPVEPGDARAEDELYALLHQLRPGLDRDAFDRLLAEGRPQGLRYLLAHSPGGRPVGAAGYRLLATSRGRIVFVDDLVTDSAARSGGVGGVLLEAVRGIGREAGCTALELDTGVANADAQRFYFRQRMSVLAFHFAAPLAPTDREDGAGGGYTDAT